MSPFVLRTSDRLLFRRCRRLWGWMSHLRQGRVLRESADYLWFGTGVHYALEDYHGLNLYGHPAMAFMAYVAASRVAGILPGTWMEHEEMGIALMSYYADEWLKHRPALDTYEVNGVPQVEINGAIDLDAETPDGRPIVYGFTMDRISIDEDGRIWIVEYKTAKQIRLFHFDVDEQITSYCWCAWKLYNVVPAGVIYQQFRKSIPTLPKILAGGRVSTDVRQSTSAALYAKQLEDFYGTVEAAPAENIHCLNKFRAMEDEDKDRFIVRHRIERNLQQMRSFEEKIHMELEDITRQDLPLYPNPTKDCEFMCPLQAACIAMDDGSDWEGTLGAYSFATDDGLTQREKEQMQWRHQLPEPQHVKLPASGVQYQQLMGQLEETKDNQVAPEEAFLQELGLQ